MQGVRAGSENAVDRAVARIPGWDGDENTWRKYLIAVSWWLEGEKVEDVDYSIAARMRLSKLQNNLEAW